MERLIRIGRITPVNSREITASRLGLGMEKLDRDAFDPHRVYDKVAALGVKWIRLQSGWQKTEREKGMYDFAWLDSQVDELLSRGLTPWLCLCYGNQLYDPLAAQYVGAVGCTPVQREEAYAAWLRYVTATVTHFCGRITYYEIWNEAEGGWTWRPQPDPKAYAAFCLTTADAIRSADAEAKIITGSHYQESLEFFNEEFASGTLSVSDAITYHAYGYDERNSLQRAKALQSLIRCYHGRAAVIQGESGSQSKSGGGGALGHIRTNESMQAKQILRHTMADLLADVLFTSVFSCVDMAENLDAKAGKPITSCGYFGLLGAAFDPATGTLIGDYTEKPSYYAFQNLCALFRETFTVCSLPVLFRPQASRRLEGFDCPTQQLVYGSLTRENGSAAFAYWHTTDLITVKGYEGTVTFEIAGVSGDVRLIDPLTGDIYTVPDEIMTVKAANGRYVFENLPVFDYPLILTFGEF